MSYAEADVALARKIADGLRREGIDVWLADEGIIPGDNWAEKVAQALQQSQAMVVLYTDHTRTASWVHREVEFALGNKGYTDRVVPVLVGETPLDSMPWILRQFQVVHLADEGETDRAVKQILQTLLAAA